MRVLVTGASGFVGGSLMRRLQQDGHHTVLGVGRRQIDMGDYRQCDLAQPITLDWNPDVVVHAAARATPWGTAREYHEQNVTATANIIDFCERQGRPRLVHVSTTSIFYRAAHQTQLTEESPAGPEFLNLYSQTKWEAEQLIHAYTGDWVITRPRAVFGPGDTTLLPRILSAAQARRLPRLGDPATPVQCDLIHIDTLVDYLLTAMSAPQAVGRSINLTNGTPVDLWEVLTDLLTRLGIPLPTRHISIRQAMAFASVCEAVWRTLRLPGEPPITRYGVSLFGYSKTFDISLAREILGDPKVTTLDGLNQLANEMRI
ncbi:NAD(P)-dependent oxidoreductase [Leucobacter viscericola]|uniref:NAD(P)-dependent oxidoreductase n=1 Tax=Leucobacter viscericola TaxID=2714935 RepID=A0A6G7XBR4_9MICO|nr:NAD(P)-dependent oxidoreductase [Leucobacter viscericola]QIK61889.1 NAD(P)-dependent oxidoreductase [Leucobacter viscericola]